MTEKLTSQEKMEIAVQSGLQLIPYIGSSISTLYFGTKQERRFKRIESFYVEFSEMVEQLNISFASVDSHDPEKLSSLIEDLNDKIEKEHVEQKRTYFKKFLYNTLATPTGENYDIQKTFLDSLANMTLLELDLLAFLNTKNHPLTVGSIEKPGINQYAIVGALGRLKMFGYLKASTGSLTVGGGIDNTLSENVSVSSFGKQFINYCII